MLSTLLQRTILCAITFCFSAQANAGLILFSDRTLFENAVDHSLTFESFEDKSYDDFIIQSDPNFIRFRTTSSHVSDGEIALSLKEKANISFTFEHDVFAFGFDINELNSSNLNYLDSLGNEITDALTITEIWNESTFFGVISDTALRSFSLSGDTTQNATFGFDAFTYTSAVMVPEPTTFTVFAMAVVVLILLRARTHQSIEI